MKKIEIDKNVFEYKFDNLYVKNKVSKKDRKCTALFTAVYKILKKLNLLKLFPKNHTLKFLNDVTFSNYDLKSKKYKKDIKFKLNFEKLYVYDILPKEKLTEFENRLKKFRNVCDKYMFKTAGFQLGETFDHLRQSTTNNCITLCDRLKLSKKISSMQYFEYLSIQLVGVSNSFFVVKYELTPNKNSKNIIHNILKENIYKSPTIHTNDKWWRLKDIGGSSYCDNRAKKYTLEDFMLEMKYVFMKDIHKHLGSFIYDNKLTPAGIEVFSTNKIDDPEELLNFFEIRREVYINKKKNIIFNLATTSTWNQNHLLDSIILVKDNDKAQNGEYNWFSEIFYNLTNEFIKYHMFLSIQFDVCNKINKSNSKINKNIAKGKNVFKLMKLNRKIDKDLFFYRRLMREISVDPNRLRETINDFLKRYDSFDLEPDELDYKYLWFAYSSCFYKFESNSEMLEDIYSFFGENINNMSAYSTMKIIRVTLEFTIFSFGIALLSFFTSDSSVAKSIINFFKNLF